MTVRFAERAPVTLGVNVTEIVHLAPAASEAGQPLLFVKFPAFVPEMVTLLIANAEVPGFERVTLSVLLLATLTVPKARLVGLKLACGGLIPVPDRLMDCGVLETLVVMLSVAAPAPAALGAKTAPIEQLFPGWSVDGQDCPMLNWDLLPLVTVNVTGPTPSALPLLLVRVT